MKLDLPDLSPHGETLAAIVLGALLAMVSGMLATQFEAHLRRRERERSAALLLGEVLLTLRVLLETADRARRQPPAYGPVTRRMLRAARREVDIYERNRESLVDLRDASLRADLHRLAVQIALPLDGILDSFESHGPADDEARDTGFAFMMENCGRIPDLVARLGRLAKHGFEHFDGAAAGAQTARSTASAAPRTPASSASE